LEILEKIEETNLYLIQIEDSLDILFLYHILKKGLGHIVIKIGWQNKREERKGYKRLDRIFAYVKLKPLKIFLSTDLENIRVTGLVLDSEYKELIGKKLGGDSEILMRKIKTGMYEE